MKKNTVLMIILIITISSFSETMVLFHGITASSGQMDWYKSAFPGYNYRSESYNSLNSIETEAARMNKTGFFDNRVFIGYSEGGLVARKFVSDMNNLSLKTFITVGTHGTGVTGSIHWMVLTPAGQQLVYDNFLMGSFESDAIVPADSAKLKSGYIKPGAKFTEPILVNDANHLDMNSSRIIDSLNKIINYK